MSPLQCRIVPRGFGKAFLYVECPQGVERGRGVQECARSLWQGPPTATDGVATMWQWDGNVERPTITPSIDCKGGCGRHFTLTQGVPR